MSVESKRKWRLANPERSRAAEATRAALRRRHGRVERIGEPPFNYPSGASYQRYETDAGRTPQEYARRFLAGSGRPAARSRSYQKALRARIARNSQRLAIAYAELGLKPGDDIRKAISDPDIWRAIMEGLFLNRKGD